MMMMAGGVAEHKRSAEALLMLSREGGGTAAAHRRGGGAKRPRSSSCCEAGASTMSLKERKDKIGDRVAALQQLVSPFGKTDTASVLHEATGYIKFLHDQLEVLSAPYLRTPLVDSQGSTCSDHYSLRRRGLCLVPVECTLKLAGSSNGADMWAPTNTGSNRKL